MKRNIIGIILCIVTVIMLFPIEVKADMGPKPSTHITFENMSDELCYGTLLSYTSITSGDFGVWDGKEEPYDRGSMEYKVWKAFIEYKDSDGYYFLQEFWLCNENKQMDWSYRAPSSFKILLYYPESDTFVTSGIYKRYAFNSYYTVDMSDIEIVSGNEAQYLLVAEKSYDYTWEIISLVCRIIITILLELFIAFLFGFRQKKIIITIAIVNIITQVILNVQLNIINYESSNFLLMLYYICFEFFVFLIEAIIYSLLLNRLSDKKNPIWKSILYALAANVASFIGGALLLYFIPGIYT